MTRPKVCIYCREENPERHLNIIEDESIVGQVFVCDEHARLLQKSKFEIFCSKPDEGGD